MRTLSVVIRSVPRRVLIVGLLAICVFTKAPAGWEISAFEREEAMQLLPDVDRGREIYEGCAVCHMPEGWGTPNGAYPQIAGQHYAVLIKQLADIRAKNRDNPSMYPFSLPEEIGGVQAIADVSFYIANLKMTSTTGKGSGEDLAHGEKLYKEHCTECHGKHGEGNQEKIVPLIQGQHYNYLLRQLIWIQNGKRRNVNQQMMEILHEFSNRDLMALSDSISRMILSKKRSASTTWSDQNRVQN